MADHYINGKPKDGERSDVDREESGLTPREEAAIIRRAIRERWPIAEQYRDGIMKRLTSIALNPESGVRASVTAARVIIAADKLNLDEELKEKPDKLDVNHSGTIELRGVLEQLLGNHDYVEYQRSRALARDTDAGAVCQLREQGYTPPLANGSAHGSAGPGANGHRNGSQ